MYVVGALLIYLAIKKDYEPSLLLPMGFGAILVNLPMLSLIHICLGKGLVPMIFVFLGSCVFRVAWIYTVFAHFQMCIRDSSVVAKKGLSFRTALFHSAAWDASSGLTYFL